MNLSYFLLAITVIFALILRNRMSVYVLLALTILVGLYQNVLSLLGVVYIFMLIVSTHYYYNSTKKDLGKRVLFALVFLLTAEFVLHFVPGFFPTVIFDQISVSDNSRLYSLYFNFDKVVAAIVLFTFSNLMIKESVIDNKAAKITFLVYAANALLILTLALLSGYVRFEPKIPHIFPIWAIHNLLFVSFSEEVVYRGFLQNAIIGWLPKSTRNAYVAIGISAIIFGLAHYTGGPIFMALAGVCGLFYGYTYYKTKRILCATLVHFGLNLTHILFFTYPSAVQLIR